MTPSESEWFERWSRDRARGRNGFLWRGTIVLGLMPGMAAALIILFVKPQVANWTFGTATEATTALVVITVVGFILSRWWWRSAEKRFHLLKKRVLSPDGSGEGRA